MDQLLGLCQGGLWLPVSTDIMATWGQLCLRTSDFLLFSELPLLQDLGIINGASLPPSGGICLYAKLTLLQ